MKPGIYDGIPNAEYHSGPGFSKSSLDLVAVAPVELRARQLRAANDVAYTPTPAMLIGTAFHSLILEPEDFAATYVHALRMQDVPGGAIDDRDVLVAMVQELNKGRLPKMAVSGSKAEMLERVKQGFADAGKTLDADALESLAAMGVADLKSKIVILNESRPGLLPTAGSRHELAQLLRDHGRPVTLWSDALAEWQANNVGRIVLTAEQFNQLFSMRDAVMAHKSARALLYGVPGVAERSVYWIDKTTGALCRCRPDFWRTDDWLVDLKTTDDASEDAFSNSIGKWRYDVQDPFYVDGCSEATGRKMKGFAFVAVEKDACVVEGVAKGVAVYLLDEESRELGRQKYQRELAVAVACSATGKWPGYSEKPKTISVANWRKSRDAAALAAV